MTRSSSRLSRPNGKHDPNAQRIFELGEYISLPASSQSGIVVAPCEIGQGLFAFRNFSLGETIFWFSGKVIDYDEINARDPSLAGHPLQVDWNRYIDVDPPGYFVNHSCDPNTGLRDNLRLVALKPIKVGDEIRFDYSTETGGQRWTMNCRCGSNKCRGVIGDFDLLAPTLQRELLRLEIVQPYIVRRLIEKCRTDEH